jgi:hypothetical protein
MEKLQKIHMKYNSNHFNFKLYHISLSLKIYDFSY